MCRAVKQLDSVVTELGFEPGPSVARVYSPNRCALLHVMSSLLAHSEGRHERNSDLGLWGARATLQTMMLCASHTQLALAATSLITEPTVARSFFRIRSAPQPPPCIPCCIWNDTSLHTGARQACECGDSDTGFQGVLWL